MQACNCNVGLKNSMNILISGDNSENFIMRFIMTNYCKSSAIGCAFLFRRVLFSMYCVLV